MSEMLVAVLASFGIVGTVGLAFIAAILLIRRSERWKEPSLKGVPLPAVDDENWTNHGTIHGECYMRGHFTVLLPRGSVYYRGIRLGGWTRYAQAVCENYNKPDYPALAERARRELAQP